MTSVIGMVVNGNNHTDFGNFSYNISNFPGGSIGTGNGTEQEQSVSKNVFVPSAMFFLGVLGNVTALVILTIAPSRDSKATAFYHLVKALALMDLLGIVASSPVTLVVYINGGGLIHTGGMALCHYSSFILVMAGNSTVFTVLVMALDRFLVSKYPFKYSRVVTPMSVNCCLGIVMGFSLLMALLPIMGVGENKEHWPHTWCFFDYRASDPGGHFVSYLFAIAGLFAILVTIILNITVIQHLWRMRKTRLIASSFRSTASNTPTRRGSRVSEPDSEKRMVIFLMAIIIVFTVCYAPLMVRVIMNQWFNSGQPPPPGGLDDIVDIWALRLASLNQILDPWVYIISRVTCCKGSRRRDDDERSYSVRSYQTVHSVHKDGPSRSPISLQDNSTKENHIVRTIQNVRNFFKRKKHDSDETGPLTVPLQSPPTHKNTTSSVPNGVHTKLAKEDDHETLTAPQEATDTQNIVTSSVPNGVSGYLTKEEDSADQIENGQLCNPDNTHIV